MEIIVSTLFDNESKKLQTHFYSKECSGNTESELWIGIKSGKYVVIDLDVYYDDKLRDRRNCDNMLSPWEPTERLMLVGNISGLTSQSVFPNSIHVGSFTMISKDWQLECNRKNDTQKPNSKNI